MSFFYCRGYCARQSTMNCHDTDGIILGSFDVLFSPNGSFQQELKIFRVFNRRYVVDIKYKSRSIKAI